MNENDHSWFAVYTKPRQEQIALANLERQAFECFLPMAKNRGQRRVTRSKSAFEPLFPRYLFLKANQEQQSLGAVRSTRGAVGLVSAGLQLNTVPDIVIDELKARVNPSDGLIPVNTDAIRDGDEVQVFDGPFAEMEGVFKEHRGRSRSLLLLEILGRKTAVEIDSRLLKRAN